MTITRRIRRGLDRFLAALDSEGVGIFQAIVYLNVVLGGLYLFTAAAGYAPQAVEETMGPHWNTLWLALCIGPLICLTGKALCWREPTKYAGMWLQLSGDLCAFGVFLVYVCATIQTAWWGKAMFALFVCMAIAECILLLILRDARRLEQVERQVRR